MESIETNDFSIDTISALANIWADWLVGFHVTVAQIEKIILEQNQGRDTPCFEQS